MKYHIEQRMKFIRAFIAKYQRINRKDIMNRWRVSNKTAQNDIAAFILENPKALKYDLKAKHYKSLI